MPISDELKAVYATAPNNDYYVETLELRHPQFQHGSRFITNQLSGWPASIEDGSEVYFEFLPFAVVPPQAGEEGNLNLKVVIDNASELLMEQLEDLSTKPTSPITVFYRIYLASDRHTVQNDPPLKLDVLAVTANPNVISFTAGLSNLRAIPFPGMLYTTALYPGLDR
ncbi:DUF1833 family protein [Parahaliea mediterranea]|uniref:DUF1833 family protein n=1 Tax=Parahaliea mediterranea TaxID=651086 RepID=UPI000E2E9E70|nr:DUF1833 family protein [Parahaliea mediterranea]